MSNSVTRQLREKYGINRGVPLSNDQKEEVRKARRNLLKKLSKQDKRDLSAHFKTIFADPDSTNMTDSREKRLMRNDLGQKAFCPKSAARKRFG